MEFSYFVGVRMEYDNDVLVIMLQQYIKSKVLLHIPHFTEEHFIALQLRYHTGVAVTDPEPLETLAIETTEDSKVLVTFRVNLLSSGTAFELLVQKKNAVGAVLEECTTLPFMSVSRKSKPNVVAKRKFHQISTLREVNTSQNATTFCKHLDTVYKYYMGLTFYQQLECTNIMGKTFHNGHLLFLRGIACQMEMSPDYDRRILGNLQQHLQSVVDKL